VAALGKENVVGVSMPSQFSSKGSVEDARELAQNLGIPLKLISIQSVYEKYMESFKEEFKGLPFGTAEENLQASARRAGGARNGRPAGIDRDLVYRYFPVLTQRRRQIAGYLSGGERQMLAIGAALLCQPTLLLVDELSLGLAPLVVQHLMELLQRLRAELGITILLVEQNVAAALEAADYGYVMENGRVVYDGTPARLLAHEDVQEFYLGMGRGAARSYRDVRQYRRRRRWFG